MRAAAADRRVRTVILAAGRGTRLGPLSAHLPKAFVEVAGRTLLAHQRRVLAACGITDVHVVLGHGHDVAVEHPDVDGLTVWRNPDYATTNMVATLFCARDVFDGTADVIIAYGDIVYEPRVIEAVLDVDAPVTIAVDRDWAAYWASRMDDPLADAETLRFGDAGRIVDVGRRPGTLEEIEGQYIGLIRVRAQDAGRFVDEWDRIVRDDARRAPGAAAVGPGLYMTDLLQILIAGGWDVRGASIRNGWLEIDRPEDLDIDIHAFWDPDA